MFRLGPPCRCGVSPRLLAQGGGRLARSDRVASLEEAKAQLKSWDALEGVGKTGGTAVGTDQQSPTPCEQLRSGCLSPPDPDRSSRFRSGRRLHPHGRSGRWLFSRSGLMMEVPPV